MVYIWSHLPLLSHIMRIKIGIASYHYIWQDGFWGTTANLPRSVKLQRQSFVPIRSQSPVRSLNNSKYSKRLVLWFTRCDVNFPDVEKIDFVTTNTWSYLDLIPLAFHSILSLSSGWSMHHSIQMCTMDARLWNHQMMSASLIRYGKWYDKLMCGGLCEQFIWQQRQMVEIPYRTARL